MQNELIVDQQSLIVIKKYAKNDETQRGKETDERLVEIQYILLPRDKETNSAFPIWIGQQEYVAIALALESVLSPPRPLTHNLFVDVLMGCDIMISRVVVTKLENETFFADIYCRRGEEEKTFDSRPSDAIVLALRYRSPIFIEESLLAQILGDEKTTDIIVFIEKNRPPIQKSPEFDDFGNVPED